MILDIDQNQIDLLFPTLKSMIYLNNASIGIPPHATIKAMNDYLHNRECAIGDFKETLELLNSIRRNLSLLLGGKEENFGLVPNTSTGVNIFAHGIEYPEGSNIVICDLEFPANYIPWQNVARIYGVELRVLRSEDGAVPTESFAEMIDENTRVVGVSHVQFASGFRNDLKSLSQVVHENGGYLFADIIQAAGCVDIDLPKMGVDFASAQAAKWLIGPIGAGFVYVDKRIIDEVDTRFLGWWGVKDLHEFGYFQREPLENATKFEVGSPAMVAYVGFNKSLETLLSFKPQTREGTAMAVANYLRECLQEVDIPVYDFGPEHNSAIVSCAPANIEELYEKMKKSKIHCSVRNERLRVSPHFYNSINEIDLIMQLMK